LVRDEDVVAFGDRDAEVAKAHGSQHIEDTAIKLIDLAEVRKRGAGEAIHQAIQTLSQPELTGFWVHLDADVLDDAVMPAVDYRMPGGLSWEELIKVLQVAIGSGRVAGLDITIFNPKLDEDGTIAAAFVDALIEGLKS
jgi:arginase